MKTIVTIKADDGEIISQFEVQPEHIEDYFKHTDYIYKFVFSMQNTETPKENTENAQLAYNRGYMEGMKRGMIGG